MQDFHSFNVIKTVPWKARIGRYSRFLFWENYLSDSHAQISVHQTYLSEKHSYLWVMYMIIMYTFVLVHRIYAMKPNSLVSATVTPDIILCPGCGGHGSCDFEGVLPQPQPSFFLVECVCDPGWTGRDVYTTTLLLLVGVCLWSWMDR